MAKTDLSLDPIINVIHKGIRRGIQVTFENGCLGSCLILIYAAMDAMASLERPANVKSVRREDFIAWADKYIRFPCKEQLTGIDLYGARCALIHQYGIESDLSRGGDC